MSTTPAERNKPLQECTTCHKPIAANNSPRCMACGAPTHAGCSVAGFCKSDIDKLWSKGGDKIVEIDRNIKKMKRTTWIAALLAIGWDFAVLFWFYYEIDFNLFTYLSADNIVLSITLLMSPMFVLMWIMFQTKNKASAAILARDGIIRDMRVALEHQPRNGFNTRSSKPFTYTCSVCHGPMHVDHASCLLCYKSLCYKCDEGGLCPAHAAALTSEEKELLPRTGDFTSKYLMNLMPIMFATLIFLGIVMILDLPKTFTIAFMMVPLAMVCFAMYKFITIDRTRQRLKNKVKTDNRDGGSKSRTKEATSP